ncbi:hypothetical protein D6D06_06781 [Aureobasidium pullulans]|nr:hypothetical protein D6D06_06781 [Aureobasidium pullulans]
MFFALAALLMGILMPCIAIAQSSQTKVTLHDIFRTPAPPGDAFAQDASHVLVVMTILIPISLGFLAFAISESKRFKTSIPIGLVVAGIFCVVPEAVNNYLGGVYWTQSHDPKQLLFILMGREFDYYVAFIWWSLSSGVGVTFYAALLRRVSTGTLWAYLALAVLADIILEEILLGYGGIYIYFGHQPLVFNLFPCWWGPANISSLFLSITLAYRYRAWFEGWRSIFLLPLVPTCYIGAWTLCGMPTVFAIQGDISPLITESAGIYSCIVAVVQSGVMMHLVLDRDPLAISGPRKKTG